MNTPSPQLVRVERVDDRPVLWACLYRMGVAELLDRRYPTHHLGVGELSLGEVVCVWLCFLLSQGDHRLSPLEPWAGQNLRALQALLGKTVRPLDFQDDRLAEVLSALPQSETWLPFEDDLNRRSLRVYDRDAVRFRLDSTTAYSHADVVSQEGLLPFACRRPTVTRAGSSLRFLLTVTRPRKEGSRPRRLPSTRLSSTSAG